MLVLLLNNRHVNLITQWRGDFRHKHIPIALVFQVWSKNRVKTPLGRVGYSGNVFVSCRIERNAGAGF